MNEYVESARDASFRSQITAARAVALVAFCALLLLVAAIAFDSDAQPQNAVGQQSGRATYKVERRVLVDGIELSGTFTRGGGRRIDAKGFQLADGSPIVTRVFARPNQKIGSGRAIVQIGPEPIFVMRGEMPMYRDLTVGKSGDDVAQLQASLSDLGYPSSDSVGVFGTGTAGSVSHFYAERGFRPTTVKASEKSAKSHPVVKLGAFNYVKRLPLVVASIDTRVGAEAGGSLVTLASTSSGLSVALEGNANDIREGMKVAFEMDGAAYSGRVTKLQNLPKADAAGQSQAESSEVAAKPPSALIAVDRPIRLNAVGRNVQVTVVRSRSRGKVTVVPVSAVLTEASGANYVWAVRDRGPRTQVMVDVGLTANGFAEVTPKAGNALTPGARVEVGAK